MKSQSRHSRYFTLWDLLLWGISVVLIVISFLLFDRANLLTLIASLIGVTSLILNAKGNPLGQLFMIVFSVLYGVISYSSAYYGEMVTYLGMTAPMALVALVSWLRNPFRGRRSEVAVSRLSRRELLPLAVLSAVVTLIFCFILAHFDTARLFWSTLSVTTSFVAVYLTFRRSPYFALAYAANDVVLIVLWMLAATTDLSLVPVVTCFLVFLANDLYGFFCWLRMQRRQAADS